MLIKGKYCVLMKVKEPLLTFLIRGASFSKGKKLSGNYYRTILEFVTKEHDMITIYGNKG
jgi:hypothetical protein